MVVGLLVWLVPKSSGWENVQQSFFNPDVFRDVVPELLGPFWFDVQIFLWCAPCIVIVGLLIAMARNVRTPALFPVRLFAVLYTDIVRGIPVILTILLLGFGVPGILQTPDWYGPFIIWGSVALVVSYSAYVAEVFRSGIESVHESQRAAARSLGMSSGQTMRAVVLPQAVRRVVPPLMNDFVSLQKDVALIGVLGPVETLRQAEIEEARTFNFTPYVAAAADLPLRIDPTDPSHRPPAAARAAAGCPQRRSDEGATAIRREGVRRAPRARPHRPRRRRRRGGLAHRRLGLGQEHPAALRQPARAHRRRRILLDGLDISEPGLDPDPIRRRIGMVFQSFNLFPHLTVAENIAIALRKVQGRTKARAEATAVELLARLGLADKAREYPDQLSGGQQQRVAIVRSLALNPEVMLLDEITSALDPELVGEVLDVVRELRRDGMTMLFATHEMSFAREISDRVCFLDVGRIVEMGTPETMFEAPTEDRTRRFLQRVIDAGRM